MEDMIAVMVEEAIVHGASDFKDHADFDRDLNLVPTRLIARVILQEIEEVPSPAFDFDTVRAMHFIDGFYTNDAGKPGLVLLQTNTERTELDYFVLFYTAYLLQTVSRNA